MAGHFEMLQSHGCLVWHPDLHVSSGELLSFIFLKVEQFTPAFDTALEQALLNAGLPGYCVYDVFGSSDVILRVWSRSESRQRLLTALDKMIGVSIRSIFVCADTPKYLWWSNFPPSLTTEELFAYSPDELKSVQKGEEKSELREKLRIKGFLYDSPRPLAPNAIKFFVRVDVAATVEKEPWIDRLQQSLGTPPVVDDISIYFSSSQAILVKATTSEYYNIGKFVIDVVRTTLTKCTTETFLVAERPNRESDDVDFDGMVLDPPLIRMSALWGIKREKVLSLPLQLRHGLSRTFSEIARTDVLSKDSRKVLSACFMARVDSDPVLMEEKLAFLNVLEGLLFKKVVPGIMARLFGRDWHAEKFASFCERGKIRNRFHPNEWDMGDSVNLLGVAEVESNNGVSGILGEGWQQGLRAALNLRNEVSHAKIDFLKNWDDVMEYLKIILPVFYKINEFTLA